MLENLWTPELGCSPCVSPFGPQVILRGPCLVELRGKVLKTGSSDRSQEPPQSEVVVENPSHCHDCNLLVVLTAEQKVEAFGEILFV